MFPTLPSVLIRVIRGQILLLSVLSVSSVVKLLPLTISQIPFSIRVILDWIKIRIRIRMKIRRRGAGCPTPGEGLYREQGARLRAALNGSGDRARTCNLVVNSHPLYH